jgi:CRISPR-associated protein Cas2
MTYLFCYDISDPKRLYRCAKTLEKFGLRVQKSFFQCDLPEDIFLKLKKSLLKVIDMKKDSLFIYMICDKCGRKAIELGTGSMLSMESFEIL